MSIKMHKKTEEELSFQNKEIERLQEQYFNHDCHLSPDDSCSTCEKYCEVCKGEKVVYKDEWTGEDDYHEVELPCPKCND
jgi:hypothetical protein